MDGTEFLGLAFAIALVAYLFVAFLKPEWFA